MLVDPEPLGDGADLSVEILDHRGPELFYFGTWARARWSRGDNAVVRRRCRGGRRAWLPAGVGDASRHFCFEVLPTNAFFHT